MPKYFSLLAWLVVLWFLLYMFFGSKNTSKKSDTTWSSVPVVQAWYEKYSSDTDFSQHVDEKIVLFFHADRCSTCKIIEKDILEKWVPEGVHMYEVNFDTETELLEKYDIRSQSSFAHIDSNGELIKRRVGGFGIDDVITKLEDIEVKPWEEIRKAAPNDRDASKSWKQKAEIDNQNEEWIQNVKSIIQNEKVDEWEQVVAMVDTSGANVETKTEYAYFAGGCFWCLEWPYEAKEWVFSAESGYAGGDEATANYRSVWGGNTKHREAVRIAYDPSVIGFEELVQHFWYQIDPTDTGGQFADRGFQYTTAIYYSNDEEKNIIQASKNALDDSGKFDEPIAVVIEPFTTFFLAEEEHQDYYLKQSAHYQRYKKGSGRADFIDQAWSDEESWKLKAERKNDVVWVDSETTDTSGQVNSEWLWEKWDSWLTDWLIDWLTKFQWGIGEEQLDEMQRKVVYNEGTEPPFDNKYRDHKEAGIYVDIVDGTPLFSSTDKFDSGTGWPSFTTPIDTLLIGLKEDRKLWMVRTEVETANDTHLGHVFNDGPWGSQRYCINSAALDFVPLEKMEEMGYGEYLVLFD